jgi:hypothetical protein
MASSKTAASAAGCDGVARRGCVCSGCCPTGSPTRDSACMSPDRSAYLPTPNYRRVDGVRPGSATTTPSTSNQSRSQRCQVTDSGWRSAPRPDRVHTGVVRPSLATLHEPGPLPHQIRRPGTESRKALEEIPRQRQADRLRFDVPSQELHVKASRQPSPLGRVGRVNTVAPRPTAADHNLGQQQSARVTTARLPSGRMSSTAKVRPAAAFLTGDAAANIRCMTLALTRRITVV